MPPVSAFDYSATTWINWTNTTTTSSTEPWAFWVTATTTNNTASTQTIWIDWTGVSNSGYREPTPEAVEARRRREAEKALAKSKSRQLLKNVLDREQRRELERDGHFHVQTKDGERVYRLKPGSPPQRIKGEDGSRWSYCIHPRESYPVDDTVAALKLLIEADEDEFLRIANASRLGAMVPA